MTMTASGNYNSDGTRRRASAATVDGTVQAVNCLMNYAAELHDMAAVLASMKRITYENALRTIETALHFIDTAELKNEINPDNFIEKR